MFLNFDAEDAAQIAIGSFLLAVPVSFSEEAWGLGSSLPIANLVLLFSLSLIFLSFYAYQSVFDKNIRFRYIEFIFRVIVAYMIAFFVVSLVLLSLDKLPLFSDPVLSLKRLIVIAMPASMGAIVVDGFDKE